MNSYSHTYFVNSLMGKKHIKVIQNNIYEFYDFMFFSIIFDFEIR